MKTQVLTSLFLCTLSLPALAEPNCSLTQDKKNCARVVACFGDGRLFHGRALGWDTGTVAGTINGQTLCTGTWDSTSRPGVAHVICENGLEVGVIYHHQDPETGTTTGKGRTNDGANVSVWSGENVLKYFSQQGFEPGTVTCGEATIPIS